MSWQEGDREQAKQDGREIQVWKEHVPMETTSTYMAGACCPIAVPPPPTLTPDHHTSQRVQGERNVRCVAPGLNRRAMHTVFLTIFRASFTLS